MNRKPGIGTDLIYQIRNKIIRLIPGKPYLIIEYRTYGKSGTDIDLFFPDVPGSKVIPPSQLLNLDFPNLVC